MLHATMKSPVVAPTTRCGGPCPGRCSAASAYLGLGVLVDMKLAATSIFCSEEVRNHACVAHAGVEEFGGEKSVSSPDRD
jgi:hypothetical protein